FLSDVYVPCAECGGARFGPEVLEVRTHGRNIREVLDLTVAQAVEVFADVPDIARRLRPLVDVGLDYLRLGQPLSTLSGGEAQRVKLAAHLGREGKAHTLFIFDEPTTGLHLADIERLLGCFARLVERGHSLIVIEHNLEVVKCADWVIDLGPEGGDAGGRLVAAGPPEAIAGTPGSHTGRYLAKVLGDGRGARAAFATEVHDAPAAGGGNGCIRIVGARERNLKDVSLELPRDRLIVMTGLSGSGKSSLAFDVLYAEGQRRYIDSLSAYARQFLHVMAKPDVDLALAQVPLLDRYREHDIDLVVATLAADAAAFEESLDRALRLGGGTVVALADGTERLYSERLFCPACDTGFPPLDPRLFSFNSRQGACPACDGAGVREELDPAAML